MTKLFIIILCLVSTGLQNITDPLEILSKIDGILKNDPAKIISDKLDFPPDCAVIRVFKEERECEIWAKDVSRDTLVLIMTLPISSMDFEPGPKLRQGDSKTPEGFYFGQFAYYSSNWFMWIDLDNVEESGNVGNGSAFRICLDYPNILDRNRSIKAGFNNPGGAICVHGNSVSIGCISFENKDFLPVYSFSRHHNTSEYGPIQFHVFPFRFENKDQTDRSTSARRFCHIGEFSEQNLLDLWENLETGYDLFKETKRPIKIVTNRSYFSSGDISNSINKIKRFLNEHYNYTGNIDNMFSDDLVISIVDFQRQNNLQTDGIIGRQTISRMREQGLNIIERGYIFRQ